MKLFISGFEKFRNKNLFQKLDKKSLLYFSIIILASFLCLGLIWHFSKVPEIKEFPQIEVEPKVKPLTPQEIQEALSKKAEPSTEISPLTPEQINQALEKKIPKKERPPSLTPEEIQKALEAK